MDATRITELRAWASRLEERETNDELRAAAKAILMLADEVENLQARLVVSETAVPPPAADEPQTLSQPPPQTKSTRSRPPSFVSRLKRTFGLE